MAVYKSINPLDFASPDEPSSYVSMDGTFLKKLDDVLLAFTGAGYKYKINSGYRTEAHNRAVKGEKNSSHCRGYAADIAVYGDRDRYILLTLLLTVGFNRIGIGKSFIHVDCDPKKSDKVIWTY